VTLLERLGLRHPIVQAGMGGGIATGELAGAVSAAGGLGTVGITAPEAMRAELMRAREGAAGGPVAANLLIPFATRAHVALAALGRVRAVAGATPLLLAGAVAGADVIARALDAGAVAVVAGTRFLLTDECGAHDEHKQRVLTASSTLETRLFGMGWPMRHHVVPNDATERWCRADPLGPPLLRGAQRLTTPLSRLPMSLTARALRTQRPGLPLFGPAVPLRGMPDHLVRASALYAGDSALRIDAIVPAAEAVATLAGATAAEVSRSRTMRSS
jgi:NAD(P)H-dependent flavin oxidoreductase YrpB (nitropropane dioxygenase family)